jgi:hypothetical protein
VRPWRGITAMDFSPAIASSRLVIGSEGGLVVGMR